MPLLRQRTVGDVLAGILGELTSPQQDSPGELLSTILAITGGLTNAGLNLGVAGVLSAATYISVGTGTAPQTVNDTALVTEVTRVPVVASATVGSVSIVQGLISAQVANGWLYEFGIIGGAGAAPVTTTKWWTADGLYLLPPPGTKTPGTPGGPGNYGKDPYVYDWLGNPFTSDRAVVTTTPGAGILYARVVLPIPVLKTHSKNMLIQYSNS